jgi:hypothetical protein
MNFGDMNTATDNLTLATPFHFRQRPFPYNFRSREISRIAEPVANVSTWDISPRISKYMRASSQSG